MADEVNGAAENVGAVDDGRGAGGASRSERSAANWPAALLVLLLIVSFVFG